MKYESVAQTWARYHHNKANGVKHTPLHTLQECCEEAGIDPRVFGRYAAKYPGAPQPVIQHEKTRWKNGKKYYRKHEFVQWVNQVRQQKEKAMPDIKTALQQALAKTATEWAADDEAHHNTEPVQVTTPKEITMQAPVATNASRSAFEFIRDNPGVNMEAVVSALKERGFKPHTVSSLVYQMLKVRLVVADTNGKLTAVVREYVPIQTSLRRKAKAKPVVAAVAAPAPTPRKHVEIVNTRTGEVLNPRKEEWTVESVIGNLNVRQALAVYMELRTVFGG
jgi:hypothetical protein